MKKIATLMAVMFLAVGLVSGVVGYDGPEDKPHIMSGGNSGSSAEATTGVGPEGKSWSSKIEPLNSTCMSGNQSDRITDITYSGQSSQEGLKKVEFTGFIKAANPCHKVTHSVEKEGDHYILKVETESSTEMCVQCIGMVSYKASFEAGGPYRLTIKHGGEKVKEIDLSGSSSGDTEKEESRGVIGLLWGWLTGLFS